MAKHLVQWDQSEIVSALTAQAILAGLAVSKIDLQVHEAEGAKTISATLEVEAVSGARTAQCRDCRQAIEFVAGVWRHVGLGQPRHPAVPVTFSRANPSTAPDGTAVP